MNYDRNVPDLANRFQATNASLIAGSYQRLTGQSLVAQAEGGDSGRALYQAPFVILAHDTQSDPVFFYANGMAQQLFEMTWQELVSLPSRLSAEPLAREERQRLLDQVTRRGYIDDYTGVRISKSGKRFLIKSATVWNLTDPAGQVLGQAASFSEWTALA